MPKPSQVRLSDTSQKAPKEQSVYLALVVTGFEEKNGEVLVHGKSMASGANVTARLGMSDNKDRPSLAQMRDGKTVKVRALEPGGVICMDRAHLDDDGVYTAHWATVMAYTREDAKNVKCGMTTVNVGQARDGHRYGNVILYSSNPDNYILGDTPESLRAKAEALADKFDRPTFTLRAVKNGNQVVSFGQILNSYNIQEKRPYTPQEVGDRVVELASKLQEQFPGTSFNVVPGMSYHMSQFNLKRDTDFERQMKFASFYQAKEGDPDTGSPIYLCRMTAFSTSHDGAYVNVIKLLDPATPGIEPIYMADIIPAHDVRQDFSASAQESEEQQINDAAPTESDAEEDMGPAPF